jgi:hypothetical protein
MSFGIDKIKGRTSHYSGYPRSDTCSICDKFLAEMKALEQRTETSETEKRKLTVLN